jgi:hypothetical protein
MLTLPPYLRHFSGHHLQPGFGHTHLDLMANLPSSRTLLAMSFLVAMTPARTFEDHLWPVPPLWLTWSYDRFAA